MTTLTDDLNVLLSWAQTTYPQTMSEVVDTEVYVNYDFSQAVVLGASYDENGKAWYAHALAWDRTHAVSDEQEIAAGSNLHDVLIAVAKFLITQANNDEKLERLLDSRPED